MLPQAWGGGGGGGGGVGGGGFKAVVTSLHPCLLPFMKALSEPSMRVLV